jgi:hypothetical protein
MTRVALCTFWATYEGQVDLAATSGEAMRFLDALNTPERLRQNAQRAKPGIVLHAASQRSELRGVTPALGELSVLPEKVLAAYELETPGPRDVSGRTAYELQRHLAARRSVRILLENGWRIEGMMSEGYAIVSGARAGKPFVACAQATIFNPLRDQEIELPFIAINARWVEACAVLSEEE